MVCVAGHGAVFAHRLPLRLGGGPSHRADVGAGAWTCAPFSTLSRSFGARGTRIVIDPDSKAAGMTHGYLLDPYLEEKDSFDCLSRAHAYWLEGRYADGALRSLRALEQVLVKRCRQARRGSGKYQRSDGNLAGSGEVVNVWSESDTVSSLLLRDVEQEVKR